MEVDTKDICLYDFHGLGCFRVVKLQNSKHAATHLVFHWVKDIDLESVIYLWASVVALEIIHAQLIV